MVIEILSPTTRKKDVFVKLMKYQNAGVREYWIVDPDKKRVIVYELEYEYIPTVYGFSDIVSVRIFEGNCKVDFSEISEYMKFMYESEGENIT